MEEGEGGVAEEGRDEETGPGGMAGGLQGVKVAGRRPGAGSASTSGHLFLAHPALIIELMFYLVKGEVAQGGEIILGQVPVPGIVNNRGFALIDSELYNMSKWQKGNNMSRLPSPIYFDEQYAHNKPGVRLLPRKRRVIAFGWYGGKFSHLNWLLPLLPKCHHYCEPFGGSAAVLLNREPSPVETYNDIDGEVVNFFQVLRDKTEELVKAIALTPFSREEFYRAIYEDADTQTDVERARRFFIRARQSRTGLAQTASLGRWANCKQTSRAGMSGVVSRWLGSVEDLPEIALRLLCVQVENRPAIEVIQLYDSPDTLFYCDPPYIHASRGDDKAYSFEMDEDAHRELAKALHSCKGKVAISGYRCEIMDELYKGWHCYEAPPMTCHSVKELRREALWMNY